MVRCKEELGAQRKLNIERGKNKKRNESVLKMTEQINYFIAEGNEAKLQAEETSNFGKKNSYVKLKAGESIRVILLDKDFVNYAGHGDYNQKIPSHVCTAPRPGMACKSCDADIKRSIKYLVPLYDVDKKEIVLFDTSKKHVAAVYSIIDTYGEDVNDEVFLLKRSGSSAQDTAYSFIPLPPKQKAGLALPADMKVFVLGSQERSDFYAGILRAPSEEYLAKIIASIPIEVPTTAAEGQGKEYDF
jgi:uncharacterized protein YdhG (YjbR/CyaY superfamily)